MDQLTMHAALHLFTVGTVLISLVIGLKALGRPKFTVTAIVKQINDLQIRPGK